MGQRIYQRAVEAKFGWGPSWVRRGIKLGLIPAPRRDPGGRRYWWPDDEIEAAYRKLNDEAERVTYPEQKAAA